MASRMRPNAILCPRTFSKVFVLHIYIDVCYFFWWNVQHFYFEYSSVVELNFKHNYKTMHAKNWMRIESLGERPWMNSVVFRPFWNPSTYLVRHFLPNKVQFWRSFWTPLPTLKWDVIYGRSLFENIKKCLRHGPQLSQKCLWRLECKKLEAIWGAC